MSFLLIFLLAEAGAATLKPSEISLRLAADNEAEQPAEASSLEASSLAQLWDAYLPDTQKKEMTRRWGPEVAECLDSTVNLVKEDWREHQGKLEHEIKSTQPEIVLLGDSITERLRGLQHGKALRSDQMWMDGQGAMKEAFGSKAFAVGWSGATTGSLLKAITSFKFLSSAKVVSILIGTNDIGKICVCNEKPCADPDLHENEAKQFAAFAFEGVKQVVKEVQKQAPSARIVLQSLFPRCDQHPGNPDQNESCDTLKMKAIQLFNKQLADLVTSSADPNVQIVDCSAIFMEEPYGTSKTVKIKTSLMKDKLHPSVEGANKWMHCLADAIVKHN